MPEPAAARLVPLPPSGRTFSASRRARFGDLSPTGRLRFDALARFVQDVSSDDTTDAQLENDLAWVVRRTAVEIVRSPRFREQLSLTTFCSGIGSRWAERRVSLTGEAGAAIEVSSLWVHLDAASGRPVPLPAEFHACYGEAAAGRLVSARLQHDASVPAGTTATPWSLRYADFDLLGHVNNAATWTMVEEVLVGRPHLQGSGPNGGEVAVRAELEYRLAIERHDEVVLRVLDGADGSARLWVVDASASAGDVPRLFATAVIRPIDPT